MTWIKENYDRFIVLVFAAALLICATMLLLDARSFNSVFDSLHQPFTRQTKIPEVAQDAVVAEEGKLAKPEQWIPRSIGNRRLPLFVSVPYISKLNPDAPNPRDREVLIDPIQDTQMLHPPIPNTWLLENKQDLLSPDVLSQDTDGDGFSTLDEWEWKTDPNNKDSHPPYWSKLFLQSFKRIAFRLRFDARNGDILQINTLDLDAPTQFLKVGDKVKGTIFKIVKFVPKSKMIDGINKDVSEVTLVNTETNEQIVLPKQEEVDSPTTYAVLFYQWSGERFAVKRNQEFTLKPDTTVKYKVTDLSDTDVTVIKEDENKVLHIKMMPPAPK
jgi:hypothetical protein